MNVCIHIIYLYLYIIILGSAMYVLESDPERGIFLFGSERTLKEFSQSKYKSSDGTFKVYGLTSGAD